MLNNFGLLIHKNRGIATGEVNLPCQTPIMQPVLGYFFVTDDKLPVKRSQYQKNDTEYQGSHPG